MIKNIAIIGVGLMGGGIARNLAVDGRFDVVVTDRSAERMAACVSEGAMATEDISTAVAQADLVITSLPLPETVVDVVSSHAQDSPRTAIWMDVSTIDPDTAQTVERLIGAGGRRFVACPLGKGPAQAEAGELPLFVGGPEEAVDELKDVFDCIGATVHRLGGVQAATTFKIVSNMIGMANLAVLAEGLTVCQSCGVEDDAFEAALRDTGAWSAQGDIRLPWLMARDFANRFAVDLALKDVRLAVDVAARRGIPVPLGAAGLAQLAAAHAHGYGTEDVDAMLKVISLQSQK